MIGENRTIRGSVKIVACQNCQATLPLFEFETETDIDSVGLCSAAQCNGLTIVIAETTMEEWRAIQSGSLLNLPPRLNQSPELKDFRVLRIKRIKRGSEPSPGIPFSEFRKSYKAPVVIYMCPCCVDGDAIETQELTVSKFEDIGGKIISLGNFVIGN